jgi:hypothetical protein
MVVQWSAHPTWYPKLLSALPKFPNNSFSRVGRSLVRNQPMALVISFGPGYVSMIVRLYICCIDGVLIWIFYTPFHDIFMT